MGNTTLERNDGARPLEQHPEAKRPEMQQPQAIVDRARADHFAGERHTDEHELATHFMLPA
jgi:hypothetical protein